MPLEDKPKDESGSEQEGAVGGTDSVKMDENEPSSTNITHELDSSGEGEVFKRQRINSPKRPTRTVSPGGEFVLTADIKFSEIQTAMFSFASCKLLCTIMDAKEFMS